MPRNVVLALAVSSCLFCFVATADDAVQPDKEIETLMCARGKLLFSDAFDKVPGKAWRARKGKWTVVDGAIRGTELKNDKHVAVIRGNLKFHNGVIQYAFKLEGTNRTTFSINDAQGHNSRVLVDASSISARKDDHDRAGPDQVVPLQTVEMAIAEGQWHTLVIEINGPDLLVRLDGEQVVYGSNPAIDVDKTNIGLTIAGESASFKNLRVWEGSPKSDWPATKAKLLAKSQK